MTKQAEASQSFRDTIATVDEHGKRKWIFPKKPKGKFYDWRSYVSYVLLAILFGLPFIKMNGEPFVMLNVLERHFILFGISFTPQDFHLLAILMITGVVFIALFTVVFGRLFCGWVCPQTIFMEMVFRKVEYWIEGDANAQRKLDKAPWNGDKVKKRVLKHGVFLIISAFIAHTFLSYIVGLDRVTEMVQQNPLEAPGGFIAIVIFIGVFYFVFSYMREQVCIAICPYGRLQGVLLDENSVNVMYDYERGEPRGKIRKGKPRKSSCTDCENCKGGVVSCSDQIMHRINHAIKTAEKAPSLVEMVQDGASRKDAVKSSPATLLAPQGSLIARSTSSPSQSSLVQKEKPLGDCIDCKLCVQVCPTGIDIRNGVQMECINCTACIDVCDEVMVKVNRDPGLIRYDSEKGIAAGERKIWTPRVIAYSVVLGLLVALNVIMLSNRTSLDAVLLRAQGQLAHVTETGQIQNLYTFQLINKSRKDLPVTFVVKNAPEAVINFVGSDPTAKAKEVTEGALFIVMPPSTDGGKKQELEITVWSGDRKLDDLSTAFIYPKK